MATMGVLSVKRFTSELVILEDVKYERTQFHQVSRIGANTATRGM